MPQRFVVPPELPWPEACWGHKLGQTVMSSDIRSKKEIFVRGRPERREWLDGIGFVWDEREHRWLKEVQPALLAYKENMDHEIKGGYIQAAALDEHNALCREAALGKYSSIATIGPAEEIAQYRKQLLEQMDEKFEEYIEANTNRDPFKNME